MTIEVDVLGHRYDNDEPAFTELRGGWYWHLKTNRCYEKVSFDAWMASETLSFAVGELGIPSLAYMRTHETILWSFEPPESSAPLTATVTKVPSATPDDTGEITIADGPADAYTSIIITQQDSTSTVASKPETIVDPRNAETPTEVAVLIAAHLGNDSNFTSVTSALGVITFTPSSGGTIDVLSVVVNYAPVVGP